LLVALACSGVVHLIVFVFVVVVVVVVVIVVVAAVTFVAVFCYIFDSRALGFSF